MLGVLGSGGSDSLPKHRKVPSFILQEWQKSTPDDFKRLKTRISSYPYQSSDDIKLQGGIQERRESFFLRKDKEYSTNESLVTGPIAEKDGTFSHHRPIDNIQGECGDGQLKNRELFPFLPRNRGNAICSSTTMFPPQNMDDIVVQGGFEERRKSFLLPNGKMFSEGRQNIKKDVKKRLSPSDFLLGDGHISRKEGSDNSTSNMAPPRVKSFRTELDLFSIDLTGQNIACNPSTGEEFKDNPFELDVGDFVDEYISPEDDGELYNGSDSSAAGASSQMEMQRQRVGGNGQQGSVLDIPDSNSVFSLNEQSRGGNDDPQKDRRMNKDEIKTSPIPIVTDSDIRIPVNVWQLTDKGEELAACGM